MNRTFTFSGLASVVVTLFAATMAQAGIVASGSQPFTEPNGFYSGIKSVTVYTDDDAGNPAPGAPGELTYVYSISNNAGSFLGIIGFNLDAPIGSVVLAGSIADADPLTPAPSAVIDNNDGVVRWDWAVPDIINPGTTAESLYIISAYTPGGVGDTIYSIEGDFSFDLQDTCIGPLDPPVQECDLEIVKEGCVVQPPSPPGDACEGKVKSFKFEYTGLGCDASSNLQDPKKTLCVGGANGTSPVDIVVGGKKHKKKRGWWGRWNKKKSKKTFASYNDVQVGDIIEVKAGHGGKKNLGSKTEIKIKIDGGGGHHHYEVIEYDKFHTSCSQPFGPGNQFGSIKITEVTSTKGGTVVFEEDPPSEECVTEIDVTPAPHCVGKVKKLTLRYTGGDCSQTMHSQPLDKVGCVDINPAETYPVRVIVSESADPNSTPYIDLSPINIGDTFVVDASTCSGELKPVTGYWIKGAGTDELIQDGFFHTSCSKPLNLGDQFGSFQVFALETTNGGTVSLEHEVTYTYDVTNPNATDATNVSVDDDLLGNIASGETVLAGETVVFSTSAFVSEETTNIATVNGEVDSVMCNEATSSVTITVTEPPEPDQICTTKIAATRLRYIGPDILGARVEMEAKTFPSELVIYDPIDLIGGVTELTMASENGFSIDGTAHGETDLGSQLKIRIDGVEENIHTSCSTPYESGKPAPLTNPKGDPSPNWLVVNFTQKN